MSKANAKKDEFRPFSYLVDLPWEYSAFHSHLAARLSGKVTTPVTADEKNS